MDGRIASCWPENKVEMQSNETDTRMSAGSDKLRAGSRRSLKIAIGTVLVCVLGVVSAGVGAEPRQEVLLAEDFFLNVPDMGEIPVDEFIETMGMFASALGLNCADCHTFESSSNWAAYADETPIKRTTRRMIQMVRDINQEHFGLESGEEPFVSCWTCHRSDLRPKTVPNLIVQYSAPVEDPNAPLFIPDPDAPPPPIFLTNISKLWVGPRRWPTFPALKPQETTTGSTPVLRTCRLKSIQTIRISLQWTSMRVLATVSGSMTARTAGSRRQTGRCRCCR